MWENICAPHGTKLTISLTQYEIDVLLDILTTHNFAKDDIDYTLGDYKTCLKKQTCNQVVITKFYNKTKDELVQKKL